MVEKTVRDIWNESVIYHEAEQIGIYKHIFLYIDEDSFSFLRF